MVGLSPTPTIDLPSFKLFAVGAFASNHGRLVDAKRKCSEKVVDSILFYMK